MAAPTYEHKQKSDKLRAKVLDELLLIVDDTPENQEKVKTWSKLKVELIKKMATSILPRLNVHSGDDEGDPIKLSVSGMKIVKDE